MSRKAMEAKKSAPRVQADSMRLDKYLAEHGFSSRTKAARALAKGLVTRNGKVAKASDEVAEGDIVEVRT